MTGSPKNIIGKKVLEARQRRKPVVTQADLSALLAEYGIILKQSAISKIEAGDRPVFDYELKAIGQALAVPVGWLIQEEAI